MREGGLWWRLPVSEDGTWKLTPEENRDLMRAQAWIRKVKAAYGGD